MHQINDYVNSQDHLVNQHFPHCNTLLLTTITHRFHLNYHCFDNTLNHSSILPFHIFILEHLNIYLIVANYNFIYYSVYSNTPILDQIVDF